MNIEDDRRMKRHYINELRRWEDTFEAFFNAERYKEALEVKKIMDNIRRYMDNTFLYPVNLTDDFDEVKDDQVWVLCDYCNVNKELSVIAHCQNTNCFGVICIVCQRERIRNSHRNGVASLCQLCNAPMEPELFNY